MPAEMSGPDSPVRVRPSLEDLHDKDISNIMRLGDWRIFGLAGSCRRFLRLARLLEGVHLRLTGDHGLQLAALPPGHPFPSVRKLTVTMTADSPLSLPATTAGLLHASKAWPGLQTIKVAVHPARGLLQDGELQLTAQEEWWNKLIGRTSPVEQLLTLSRFTSLTKLKLSVELLSGHAIAPLAALTGLTKLTLSADISELGRESDTPLTQLTALQQLKRLALEYVPAPGRDLQPLADSEAAAAAAAAVADGMGAAAAAEAAAEAALAGGDVLQLAPWFPDSLTSLYLLNTPEPGVWVKAAARSCPQLEALAVDWDCQEGGAEFDLSDHPSCILRDTAHCFPKLRSLRLTKYLGDAAFSSWETDDDVDMIIEVAHSYGHEVWSALMIEALLTDLVVVPQLTHLTSLTELRVSGWRMRLCEEEHWQRLGALSQLRQLAGIAAEVAPPAGLTWPHLTQLSGRPMWATGPSADWSPLLTACPQLRWLWVKTSHRPHWPTAGALRPAPAHLRLPTRADTAASGASM